jgi:hypothetical protein
MGAGLARIIVLICSAMMLSMPVTPHMSAILTNSTTVEIESVGVELPKTTRPRYNHCTSNSKLRTETTPSSSFNVALKYGDCLHRRAFDSLYSRLDDPIRIVTRGPEYSGKELFDESMRHCKRFLLTYDKTKSLNGLSRTASDMVTMKTRNCSLYVLLSWFHNAGSALAPHHFNHHSNPLIVLHNN